MGTSEQVVSFAKEGVTYIKPTEFQNDVVVQETIASFGPVSYVQKNIANSIMHEMDGKGNVYHAGSGVLNSNLHVKQKSYLTGNVLAQSNLTVNGVLQPKKEVALEFLNNVSAHKINKYAANPELWFQTGQTSSNVEPMLKLKETNVQIGNTQRDVQITWNSSNQYQQFLIPPGHVIELWDSSYTQKPSISPDTCNNWPRIFMQQGAQIHNLGDPTADQDAAYKRFVDSKLTSLYSAVNTSSDFATLKANLLTTLSGAFN